MSHRFLLASARWAGATAGAALFFSLAAGCSGARPENPTLLANANPSSSVTITLWHSEKDPASSLLDEMAADFHKAYPTITVHIEVKESEGDLLRQGIAAVALDQPPDLALTSMRTIAEFARRGALVSLNPFLDDPSTGLPPQDRADLLPGALDAGRCPELKNQVYGFPFDERAVVLYYNGDQLQAAQVKTPHTWDDFSAAARGTTRGNARGWVMVADASVFYAFVYSRGGSVLNDAQGQVTFNQDPGMKALQLIAALSQGGSAYLDDSEGQALGDFAQGSAALWFGTTADLSAVSTAVDRAARFQWGVTALPQNDPGHPATALAGEDIAVFKTTDDQERAAWLFTRWLTAPEQAARWSSTTLAMPLRSTSIPLIDAEGPPVWAKLRDSLGNPSATGRAIPTLQDAAEIDQAVVEMWTSAAEGTDPAEAMAGAVARVSRILGQTP